MVSSHFTACPSVCQSVPMLWLSSSFLGIFLLKLQSLCFMLRLTLDMLGVCVHVGHGPPHPIVSSLGITAASDGHQNIFMCMRSTVYALCVRIRSKWILFVLAHRQYNVTLCLSAYGVGTELPCLVLYSAAFRVSLCQSFLWMYDFNPSFSCTLLTSHLHSNRGSDVCDHVPVGGQSC